MVASVVLTVVRGPLDGLEYVATERTTWVLGRSRDCDPRLPDDADHRTVSRHHCLLDVNPPQVRIRDFGSLNGTRVNGMVIGRRRSGQTPQDALSQPFPEYDLKDGDELRLGDTVLRVRIRQAEPAPQTQIVRVDPDGQPAPDDPDSAVISLLGGPPTGLAGYDVVRELGRGGIGAVFLARHTRTGHQVALKVMLPQTEVSAEVGAQFLREIAATRTLRHENIAALHDAGEHDGIFWFTGEYCAGGSLAGLIARHGGVLPANIAVPLFLQALDGLDHAHRHGVVHRGLNPQSILLTPGSTPTVKLGDFGLAKAFDQVGLSGLTRTGSTADKPYFMPRQQVAHFRRARPDVDTWALAACLYHALTGAYPRDFSVGRDPWLTILTQDAVPVRYRLPGLAPGLAEVLDHALCEVPSIGFPTAGDFRDALQACW